MLLYVCVVLRCVVALLSCDGLCVVMRGGELLLVCVDVRVVVFGYVGVVLSFDVFRSVVLVLCCCGIVA